MIILVVLILSAVFHTESLPTLEEVRNHYQLAAVNEKDCQYLIKELDGVSAKQHALFYGYRGSAFIIQAKYNLLPHNKLNTYREGKKMLESAIVSDPVNVELRFLRYSIQTQLPSFLNYRKNIDDDKKILLNSVNAINDQQLKTMIKNYLIKHGQLSAAEKNKI